MSMSIESLFQNLLGIVLTPLLFVVGISFTMLKRLSTFRRRKNDEGLSNGTSGAGKDLPSKENGQASQKKAAEPDHHSASRTEVQSSFQQFGQLLHASRRPLPTQSGDGAYLDHEEPSGLKEDLKSLGFKDVKTLMEVMKSKGAGGLQDDKTYLMERVIQVSSIHSPYNWPHAYRHGQLVSGLPKLSKTRVDLTNSFIDELWDSMQHPPMSYLGDKFQYRQADGSYNVGCQTTPYHQVD